MDAGQYSTDFTKASDETELLQACIAELQKLEDAKKFVDVRCKDNIPTQNRLVKLIGNKPIFDCSMNGVNTEALLDTGSMVSVSNSKWVQENFPDSEIRPISDFLESDDEKVKVKFTAANNSEVFMVGVVVLNFSIGDHSFPVPFLVTDSVLTQPIIGYNVIEYFIKTSKPEDVISLLVNSSHGVDAGKIKGMVNVVNQTVVDDDFLGDLRAVKPCVIPPKSSVRIRCRVKGDVKGLDLNFLCSEPLVADWDDDLIVSESLGELVRGRTPHVNIEIRNTSSTEKFIRKNMIVGEITAIKSVLPFKLFNESPVEVDVASVKASENVESEPKWQPKANLAHLPDDQRKEIEELLYEECEVFAKSDTDIGDIRDFQMDIHLTDEIPVNQAYRHLPRKLYDDVKNYLNDLIVNGWIQESSSPYASPIVCVRKKDNTLRLCVDYRKLNLKTVPDRQPIPRVQDLLDGLHGQKFFSTLDMAKAYHQGYIRDICRKYTAFSTPWALFEWLRIPFGLKNAPAAFQKYINTALSGLLDKVCLAYLDDILIYGKTFKEAKMNLRTVLKRLKEKGVKLRVDKCEFIKPEVRYLGRLVSAEGYRADPEDVKALQKFREPPKTVGDVRSLLGFLGYYRSYVRDFAKKLKPVYDLLKFDEKASPAKSGKSVQNKGYDKKKPIVWNSDLQARVDDVIDTLQSPEVMAFPDFDSPFIVNTDASGVGLGAVLYQKQGEEKLNRVISYASRTLTNAERNYHLHSGKLEFLALKWAVTEKFADYLGHGAQSVIYTDNNPLTYVMTSAKLNATGMRWVADLAGYDFELKYRPGKSNNDADGLSRNPIPNDLDTLERECTATCDKNILSSVLTGPKDATCYAVSAELLHLPPIDGYTPLSIDELQNTQLADPVVGPVYQSVQLGVRPSRQEWKELSNRCKVLFRQWNKLSVVNGVLVRKTQKDTQIILPESLHQLVYVELHQKMGHLGLERVMDLARRRFFWPHMAADTDNYIKNKCPCVVSKKPNIAERAPLVPIHATKPFEMISIDYLKVDRGKRGFEFILVVVDHFTRFAQAYATRKNSSRAAADKIFNHFILQYGFPTRIHHDLGREFNSNLLKDLHKLTGVKMSNTTPYHPEGDGQCERANRTIINMLKSIPEKEKSSWMDHLPKLMFAYNATVNKTTQFSPFFLLMGREPRLPIDDVFPDVSTAPVGTTQSENGIQDPERNRDKIGQFVKQWNRRMTQAYDLANKNIGKSADYNKTKYDQKATASELSCGDRVLVRNVRPKGTTRSGKLASYWNPIVYVVVEKLKGIPVYVVKEWNSRNKKTRTLHRNLLKQINELASVPSTAQIPVPGTVTSSDNVVPDVVNPSTLQSRQNVTNKTVVSARSPSPSKRDSRHTRPARVAREPTQKHTRVGDSKPQKHHQTTPKPAPRPIVSYSSDSDTDSDDTVVILNKRHVRPSYERLLPSLLRGRGRDSRSSLAAHSESSDDITIAQDNDGEQSLISDIASDIDDDAHSVVVDEQFPDATDQDTEVEVSEESESVIEVSEESESVIEVSEESIFEDEDDVAKDNNVLEDANDDSFYSAHSVQSSDSAGPSHHSSPTLNEAVDTTLNEAVDTSLNEAVDTFELDDTPTELDDSLDRYPDVERPVLRRSARKKEARKDLDYDELGNPVWKSRERVKKAKKGSKVQKAVTQ